MTKTAIFGGTFNPVHNEHISLTKRAIEFLGVDKIIVIPTFIPPHKSVKLLPAENRLEMLKLAFKDCPAVEISDYEIKNQGKSYSYVTVEHFKRLLDGELFFIVGGDMLKDFKTWKNPERILQNATLVAVKRQGFDTDESLEREYFIKTFGKDFVSMPFSGQDVSSTEIRIYASLGLDIANFVPKSVADYVRKNQLFKGGVYEDFIKNSLPLKRLTHTANVTVCALKKAKELGLSEEKVKTATLLHDCAKYIDHQTVKGFSLPRDVPNSVIHSFLGAFVAENVLGVKDQEVIDAIRYHTSGKANMSTLGKLVFVADMIEKDRDYDGVDKLRLLYDEDFERCFRECLKEETLHLKNKKQYVYIETLNAYDYYINKNNG